MFRADRRPIGRKGGAFLMLACAAMGGSAGGIIGLMIAALGACWMEPGAWIIGIAGGGFAWGWLAGIYQSNC